jgi:hypothetical protein
MLQHAETEDAVQIVTEAAIGRLYLQGTGKSLTLTLT